MRVRMRELFVALCTALLLLLVMVTATPAQAQRTQAEFIDCRTLPGGFSGTAQIYPPEFSDSAHPLFYHALTWYAWVYHYDHTGALRGQPVWTNWYIKQPNGRWSPLSFYNTTVWPSGGVATYTYLYDWTTQQWLYFERVGPTSWCPIR